MDILAISLPPAQPEKELALAGQSEQQRPHGWSCGLAIIWLIFHMRNPLSKAWLEKLGLNKDVLIECGSFYGFHGKISAGGQWT